VNNVLIALIPATFIGVSMQCVRWHVETLTKNKKRVITERKHAQELTVETAQAKVLSLDERIKALECTNNAESAAATEGKMSILLAEVQELKEALAIVDPAALIKLAEKKERAKRQKESGTAPTAPADVGGSGKSGGWAEMLQQITAWVPSSWSGRVLDGSRENHKQENSSGISTGGTSTGATSTDGTSHSRIQHQLPAGDVIPGPAER
jgi:hypothetical protein